MLRLARLLLICLLGLTLPVQGIAAALMALHDSAAQTSAVSASAMESCHATPHAQSDAEAGHQPDTGGTHDLDKFKRCGSCCVAVVAILATAPELFPQARDRFLVARPLATKGFIPDGLERPPRLVS